MAKYRVFTEQEVEHFMEYGWVKLEQAFAREDALRAQEFLWAKLEERGISKTDPDAWPGIHTIQENYNTPEFQVCNTDRLLDAINDIVGAGRTRAERSAQVGWGWWQCNFAIGADRPWGVPKQGWHYDGIHFRHYLDSPEQGLLLLCIFSDVNHQGGGTFVVEGSHNLVARILKEHPEGLDLGEAIRLVQQHPYIAELIGRGPQAEAAASNDIYAERAEEAADPDNEQRIEKFMKTTYHDPEGYSMRVIETTAQAGDAIVCHPFLYHSASQNHLRVPRFMCNRTTPLKERMNFHRDNPADYSPLELSIRRAVFAD